MTRDELVGKYKNIRHWFESVWAVMKNGYPARKLKVIGVTGTDGKTTTCHLIYEMLKTAGKKVALVSTVAAYIGDEEIDTGFHVTTPDAKFLQPLIKRIADAGMEYLVLETTSHGLDQHRVLGCNFLVGVITNITHEHLDYHGTFAKYKAAKMKLLRMAKRPIFKYAKTKIKITNPALVGEYNKYNIGAAIAVVRMFKVQDSIINKVVRNFAGVPGRMEEVKLGQKFRAIVDFAHTPNALEQVLKTLNAQCAAHRKLILVFGCAGLRDILKRPMMGKIARKLADVVIVTAEDPRTEKLDDIYKQIVSGITPLNPPLTSQDASRRLDLRGGNPKGGGDILREDNRQKAINLAVSLAKKGDIVVVTGKGHEKSMCFGTVERPWSDVEAVKRAIRLLE